MEHLGDQRRRGDRADAGEPGQDAGLVAVREGGGFLGERRLQVGVEGAHVPQDEVEALELARGLGAQVGAQQVIGRDVLLQAEAVEQRLLPDLPLTHHGPALRTRRTESGAPHHSNGLSQQNQREAAVEGTPPGCLLPLVSGHRRSPPGLTLNGIVRPKAARPLSGVAFGKAAIGRRAALCGSPP
jgi:hypothetical protein